MKDEKTVIKLIRNGKRVGEATFTNYEKALRYANDKCFEGYTCLILRYTNEKEWVKFRLEPSETL